MKPVPEDHSKVPSVGTNPFAKLNLRSKLKILGLSASVLGALVALVKAIPSGSPELNQSQTSRESIQESGEPSYAQVLILPEMIAGGEPVLYCRGKYFDSDKYGIFRLPLECLGCEVLVFAGRKRVHSFLLKDLGNGTQTEEVSVRSTTEAPNE